MAVVLPGKFLYVANYHVASLATAQALDEQIEETYRVGPHHASPDRLLKVRQDFFVRQHEHLEPGDVMDGSEVTVATVRNPYDWLVSCWLRRGGGVPFVQYVAELCETSPGAYVRNGKIFWHEADELLHWEHLPEELNAFLSRFGLSGMALPHKNQTAGKKPWRGYYNVEIVGLVNRRFGADIERLGYAFEVT